MVGNDYPKRILPMNGWRIGIKGDEILYYCADSVIAHRVDGTIPECITENLGERSLTLTALPLRRIPNLSTNLLGGKFEIDDFKFNTKNEGKEEWDGKRSTEKMLVETNYELITGDMFVIGWFVKEIENCPIPYKRVFSDKNQYNEFKKASTDDKYFEEFEKLPRDDSKSRYLGTQGIVHLSHCPTNLNYWHFTIDLFPSENSKTPIIDIKSAWRQMMADNVRDILCKTFQIIPNELKPPIIFKWRTMVYKKMGWPLIALNFVQTGLERLLIYVKNHIIN